MATRSIVSTSVEEIILAHIGENVELTPETDLLDDLAIDSLELVEVGLKIEKQFGKKIAASDLHKCVTVGELIELVQKVTGEA